MEEKLVREIFDTLKRAGLATSESEFSRFWLGQSESYMRSVRFKRTEPSLGALAICASRLQKAGETLNVVTRYQNLARQLLNLGYRCHEEINKGALELDLS